MGNIRSKMIKVTGKLFDKRRRLVGNPNEIFYWLRRESRTNKFTVLKTFTSGFIARSGRFRNQSDFEVCTEEDLSIVATETSHVCLGTKVYAVSEGDIIPPNDMRFTWLVTARVTNQTFVAP